MEKIKNRYLVENIFSYISSEIRELELIKYNNKLKKILKINKYNYQKLFIQNHFKVDLSKFKLSNLIKFFKSKYNNFSGKDDKNNLKKIISEIPWFGDYKKEKIITKNSNNYRECLNNKEIDNLMKLNNNQILSNLRILNIHHLNNIVIKDKFPNLVKLKVREGDIIISYDLLKRIQALSLINSTIKIDKDKTIELLSLKRLKIVCDKFNYEFNFPKIICPNVEHLFLAAERDAPLHFEIRDYHQIPSKFSKLIYCNMQYDSRGEAISLGLIDEDYTKVIIWKSGKDLFKYEIQTYSHKVKEDYYKLDFEILSYSDEDIEQDSQGPENLDQYFKTFYFSKNGETKKYF